MFSFAVVILNFQAEDVIGQVQGEDAQRRGQLTTLFQDTQRLVEEMDEQVLRHLQGEGTCPEHLPQHLQGLQSNKCPVLVTGEAWTYLFSLHHSKYCFSLRRNFGIAFPVYPTHMTVFHSARHNSQNRTVNILF